MLKALLVEANHLKKEATIEKAYPSIFVVRYDENDRSVSYQYKDVLTRSVEVDVFDGEGYSPLVPPTQKGIRKLRTTL